MRLLIRRSAKPQHVGHDPHIGWDEGLVLVLVKALVFTAVD